MIKIVNDKIDKLKLNKNNFYVLTDFDNTITEKDSKSNIGAINKSKILDKDFYREIQEVYDEYNMEIFNAKDKNKVNSKKIKSFFEIYKKYNLTYEIIEEVMNDSDIKIRKEMIDFFRYLNNYKIPVIIVSAGMCKCIEILLKNNKIYYDNITIIANDIEFNENGEITNIPDKIINPVNKDKIVFSEKIIEKIKDRDYILLLGDVAGDIKMIGDADRKKILSIAFDNNKGNVEELEKEFDIITSDGAILKILEERIKMSKNEEILEKGLPSYLENDLQNLKEGIKNKVSYLDCLINELQGSVNSAFVDGYISEEQCDYLYKKYIRMEEEND